MNESNNSELPPYMIDQDTQLKQMSRQKPATAHELTRIRGFGDKRASKYGNAILAIVKQYK